MSQIWITAGIGLATIIGAYLAARLSRPKIEAESREIIGRTYKGLIEELRHEINGVKRDLEHERKRNYALEAWAKALVTQVFELGDSPREYEQYKRVYFGGS